MDAAKIDITYGTVGDILLKSYPIFLEKDEAKKVRYFMISYAVVTTLRKAASYEPRIAILGILGDTWLTRGKYGIYVAVRGSYGVYVTPSAI